VPLPLVQEVERPGIIDLGWGHPDPGSLPAEAWSTAIAAALRRYGWQALTYGAAAGPGPLVEWLCDRLSRIDGAAPTPSATFVTSGASQALELVSGMLVERGDVVLVDAPTYHLALRIFADRSAELHPVPVDRLGIVPDATLDLIRELERRGKRVALLYLVPTFGNPTGASLGAERRTALAALASQTGVTIVEDDTYRELSYVDTSPPSLWSIAHGDRVVRVGSFSKSVAPGLRLGWLNAKPGFVRRLAERGFVDSGGCLNHTNALAMAEFGASGGYDDHLAVLRGLYRQRRDALVSAVRRHLGTDLATPDGGWFLWVPLGDVDCRQLLLSAERRGVSYLPGTNFFVRPEAGRYWRKAPACWARR